MLIMRMLFVVRALLGGVNSAIPVMLVNMFVRMLMLLVMMGIDVIRLFREMSGFPVPLIRGFVAVLAFIRVSSRCEIRSCILLNDDLALDALAIAAAARVATAGTATVGAV